MTKKKTARRALFMSVMSLILCCAMLMGTTFAWFTDSVTSANNKIVAGNLDIELSHKNYNQDVTEYDEVGADSIFDNVLWEPGHVEVENLKIANKGTLALKYQLQVNVASETGSVNQAGENFLVSQYLMFALLDETVTSREEAISKATNANAIALKDNKWTIPGNLLATQEKEVTLVVWMPETVGNEANHALTANAPEVTLGLTLQATQVENESDSFGNTYDENAILGYIPVSNTAELKDALARKEPNIALTRGFEITETIPIDYEVNINGAGFTLRRSSEFTGNMFTVKAGSTLSFENITLDGGAVWTGTVDPVLGRGTTNSGATATGSLIAAEGAGNIVLNNDAILQNNVGALAVNLGTRIGATLTLNGGEISNNHSDAGAIWGGGHITVNSGKINSNSSSGIAGAIRMVSNCNLTMNGGEISNNKAATNGGAIWGYGASTYNLNGGKMSNNTAEVGGAIYTGDASVVNIGGSFELVNNTAENSGAIRITNRTVFNMSGGKVSGNTSTSDSRFDAFYGWNPIVNISGGTLEDNIFIQGNLTPTVGGSGITGTVYFDVGTNHNTVNLAKDFGTIKFVATEGSNFNAFHFQPAAGYTYTDGDESKLVCLNNGYTTYWDAATSTFRLKAN